MIKVLLAHKENGFIWNFINVYGAAQNDHKQKFLVELASFCSKCNYPMLVGGDFNILRKESDKNKPGELTAGVPCSILSLTFIALLNLI
jgi:exonuclease III